LAIGLSELFAPGKINDMLGIDDTPQRRGVLRVFGIREIGQGISI
jgi:hypothetical protein